MMSTNHLGTDRRAGSSGRRAGRARALEQIGERALGRAFDRDVVPRTLSPRYYTYYKLSSNGGFDMDRIINYTVILPLLRQKEIRNKKYAGPFYSLYKHYEKR